MRLIALQPPPPTPTTLILAPVFGSRLLTTISYDGIGPAELCLEDIIISDENGQALGVAEADCAILDIVATPGDTNLDGNVNIQDIVVLLNFILFWIYNGRGSFY